MRTYKTEGIILRRSNYGEADRLLTIFTKHYGKIRVRAPGVRRTKSHKAASLEMFNLAVLFLVTGKTIDIVTEAQTVNNFGGMKKDLTKVAVAYYFCELVDSLCPERQENFEVYELLKEFLKKLNVEIATLPEGRTDWYIPAAPRNDEIIKAFGNKLLVILGFLQPNRILKNGDLENFIENLLERPLKSNKLLRKI